MDMKILSGLLVLSFSLTAFEAYASGCSNRVRDDFISGVKSLVYSAEELAIKGDAEAELLLLRKAGDSYPAIKEVSDCLAAHAVKAAFPKCVDVFEKAKEFALAVKAGKVTVNSGATDGDGKLAEAGLTAPTDVIKYYKAYPGPTLNGGYFNGADGVLFLKVEGEEEGAGGYSDLYSKITSITKQCNQAGGIPTYIDPKLESDNKEGSAVLDVYLGSVISCSFVVRIVNSEVRFEVEEKYRTCVENSTSMIANIIQTDPGTGAIVSRKALAPAKEFLSTTIAEAVRVNATEEAVESINSIVDAIDTGATVNLTTVANSLKLSDIKFWDVASLDQGILDIVKYCEYGAEPGNTDDDAAFLAVWNSGDKSLIISPDNSWGINKGNYYWSMYWGQYQNAQLYPVLKTLHKEYKSGLITPFDLWNWQGDALAMCYLNYPTYWGEAYIFDFINDRKLDDRSLIPAWYDAASIFPD
jgi:hypothetical protein